MDNFAGGVAVITGGASGLGKQFAQQCADLGMHLMLADVQQDALDATVAELRAKGYSFVTTSTLLGMGKPQRTMNGYFTSPGDNKALDSQFGVDGTGRHTPFNGN